MSTPASQAPDLDTLPPAVREAFLVLQAEVAGLRAQTERQDYLIAELRHALYGKRSEQLDLDDRQLAFEDLCALAQWQPCDGHVSRGFEGILQVDGYAGYIALAELRRVGGAPLMLAYCWAHSRRKLHDIYRQGGSEIAAEGLRRIALLYKIEASIRGRSSEERLAIRQQKSAPLTADFRLWSTQQRSRISAKSRLGEKLSYIHRHWQELQIFMTDGRVEIDNNTAERGMGAIAKRGSLCGPSSSICKHWKCVRFDDATRVAFSGYGSFDHLRGQVLGADLIRRTGYDLHSRQYAGFDKVPYPVVCHA